MRGIGDSSQWIFRWMQLLQSRRTTFWSFAFWADSIVHDHYWCCVRCVGGVKNVWSRWSIDGMNHCSLPSDFFGYQYSSSACPFYMFYRPISCRPIGSLKKSCVPPGLVKGHAFSKFQNRLAIWWMESCSPPIKLRFSTYSSYILLAKFPGPGQLGVLYRNLTRRSSEPHHFWTCSENFVVGVERFEKVVYHLSSRCECSFFPFFTWRLCPEQNLWAQHGSSLLYESQIREGATWLHRHGYGLCQTPTWAMTGKPWWKWGQSSRTCWSSSEVRENFPTSAIVWAPWS